MSNPYTDGISTAFAVAHILLAGIWVLPLTALWFTSFCLGRRRLDPARVGVSWLKAVYPFWILSITLQALQAGAVAYWTTATLSYSYTTNITNVSATIFQAARYCQHIADILLFITLVELANGFTLCLNGGQPTKRRKQFRYAAFTWGFVLFIVATVLFGIRANFSSTDVDGVASGGQLIFTINILLFLTSSAILVFVSYIAHKARKNVLLYRISSILLAATILDMIRLFVTLVIYLYWQVELWLGGHSMRDGMLEWPVLGHTDIGSGNSLPTIEAFFNFVIMFVVLLLLFILISRKRKGLWSNKQPDWGIAAKLNHAVSPVTATRSATPAVDLEMAPQGQQQQIQEQQLSPPADRQLSPQPLHVTIPQHPEPAYQHHQARVLPFQESPGSSSSRSLHHPSPTSSHIRRIRTLQEMESDKVLLPSPQSPSSHPRLHPLPSPRHPSPPPSPIEESSILGVADGFQMQNLDPAPPDYDEANASSGWTKEDNNSH